MKMKYQNQTPTTKSCLFCQDTIRGRADKKFCDDYCRTAFNNQRLITRMKHIRAIINILVRNRKVLKKWANKKRNPVKLQDVLSEGLNLNYYTHKVQQPMGNPYCYCFDYGYQLLPGNQCRILQQRTQ